MQIIVRPRQAGKTTELVQMAVVNQYDILVFNKHEKDRILKAYTELNDDQVFTWDEIPKRRGNRHYFGTVIDNVDFILSQHLHNRLRAMSMSNFDDHSIHEERNQ